MKRNSFLLIAAAVFFTPHLATPSFAEAINCQGAADCQSKIKASQADGAVCFSDTWVPKPESGWPESCRTEFTCSDKTIHGRAYFPPIGQVAKWLKDPTNSAGGKPYVGTMFVRKANFFSGVTKYTNSYETWALDPASTSTSQGEAFRGNSPNGSNYFRNPANEAGLDFYCDKIAKEVPEEKYGWFLNASKRVYTGRVIERWENGQIVREKESEDKVKIFAEGVLTMKKK
jgi:hypothetical protein